MTQTKLFIEERLEREFFKFHRENPHIYKILLRFCNEVWNRGYRHYSIKAIVERARWHAKFESTDPDWKLSNNHTAYYARFIMNVNPHLQNFFVTKELRSQR
jgi:hypothetical protein